MAKKSASDKYRDEILQRVSDVVAGHVGCPIPSPAEALMPDWCDLDSFSTLVSTITEVFAPRGRTEEGDAVPLWPAAWSGWESINGIVDYLVAVESGKA